jgi:hypothetical protein
MNDVAAVEAAMHEGMSDARTRQDLYRSRPGAGVRAGTVGADPEPVELSADRAVAGTGGGR